MSVYAFSLSLPLNVSSVLLSGGTVGRVVKSSYQFDLDVFLVFSDCVFGLVTSVFFSFFFSSLSFRRHADS